jgi:hypothetical protein
MMRDAIAEKQIDFHNDRSYYCGGDEETLLQHYYERFQSNSHGIFAPLLAISYESMHQHHNNYSK